MTAALVTMPRMRGSAIISALPFILSERERQEVLAIYASDALMVIANNTAVYPHASTIGRRYLDIVQPPKEETRTADEVISHMKSKLKEVSEDGLV